MIFEFLIVYRKEISTDIRITLKETLTIALQDNYDEFDSERVEQMISLKTERISEESTDEDDNLGHKVILGFTLDLLEDIDEAQTVVDEFAKALIEDENSIFHIVKFEDPLLKAELAQWSEEIFAIEMKLRRVLTFIYLYAYQEEDPYQLLKEEKEQPMSKDKTNTDQMKKVLENQFFHLVFSQYVNLNQRTEFKFPLLLEKIQNAETYDIFRREIKRIPIEYEEDASLLAGLKPKMDAIEAMRNCIAHNRRPSIRVVNNYENAHPLLNQLLDDYLNQWAWCETVEGEFSQSETEEESNL